MSVSSNTTFIFNYLAKTPATQHNGGGLWEQINQVPWQNLVDVTKARKRSRFCYYDNCEYDFMY